MQKPTMQAKNSKNQVIDLEPIEIEVEISQRMLSPSEKLMYNCQTTSDHIASQSYNQILNGTIENILLSIAEGSKPDVSGFSRLNAVKKIGISYIAVLNLQYIQKLNYILLKVEQLKAQIDEQFIRNQIKHWKQQLHFAILDTTEETQKYGAAKTQTISNTNVEIKQSEDMNQQVSSQNSGNCMIAEDKNGGINEQKVQIAKADLQANDQQSKSRQLRKSKRNGGINKNGEGSQVLCDNIDN